MVKTKPSHGEYRSRKKKMILKNCRKLLSLHLGKLKAFVAPQAELMHRYGRFLRGRLVSVGRPVAKGL